VGSAANLVDLKEDLGRIRAAGARSAKMATASSLARQPGTQSQRKRPHKL
jgi:hypothetical protein